MEWKWNVKQHQIELKFVSINENRIHACGPMVR